MNVSTRGWLDRAPDGRRRMTAKQKDLIVRAVHAALDPCQADGGETVKLARMIVVGALEDYPEDRSCRTCDFLNGTDYCMNWRADVPPDAIEKGCDRHQDDGVPF